jgi:hypothetical protein
MPIDQTIQELANILLSRQNMIQAGRYFAEGLQSAGVNSGFSASNTTGRTGVAGGRGDSETERRLDSVARKEEAARKTQTKHLEMEARLRKVLNSQYSDHSVLIKNVTGALKTIQPNMENFSKDMGTISDVMSDRIRNISDSFKTYEKEMKFWRKVRKKTGEDLNQIEEMRARNLKLLEQGNLSPRYKARLEKNLIKLEERRAKVVEKATEIQERNNSILSKFSVGALIGMFADAARKLKDDVSAQFRFGTIGGIGQQQLRSVMLGGVDPSALSEMSAQARMATIAMGGQEAMYDAMQKKQWENIKITGDVAEAARHTTEMLQAMGQAGIRPSLDEFDALTQQFNYLHRMTGMTAEAYRGLFTQISSNSDVRQRLQALDKEQRRRALQGIMLRIKENVAMGMTVEQATRAAEALAGIAGKGPKERFKQAAQLQMITGALGIAGGAQAAEALRLGDRASEEQKGILQGVLKEVANARAESRTGDLGMEFAIDRMIQGLPEAGKDSPFVTTLTSALRPDGEIAKGIQTTAEQGGLMNTTLTTIAVSVAAIQNILSSSAFGTALAALGGAAAMAGRGAIASGAKGLWGWLTGGGGAAAAAGGGKGLLARGAAMAGRAGVAGGALYGTYQAGQAALTGRSDVHDALTSKSWGMWISDKIGQALHGDIRAVFGGEERAAREGVVHQMEQTGKKTADNSDKQVEQGEKSLTLAERQTQILELIAKNQVGMIGDAEAQRRINDLQMGMIQSTVPGT